MPITNLKLCYDKATNTQEIVTTLTNLIVKTLKKKREVTVVTVQRIQPSEWFLNAEPVTDQSSFYLDIKITAGTVSKEQKETFVREVFEYFAGFMPNMIEESYVYIEEVLGDAYGYGGKSQHSRNTTTI